LQRKNFRVEVKSSTFTLINKNLTITLFPLYLRISSIII
jgi:hypothetical protein